MRKTVSAVLLFLLSLTVASTASAHGEPPPLLDLSLSRDFGYGGFDNSIEGLFTISATGPEDLARVDFYVGDTIMASVSAVPFRHQFSTSEYAPGEHVLSAKGFTTTGEELDSEQLHRVFLTKEQSGQATLGLVVPLLGGVAVILLVITLGTMLSGKRKPFTGTYGMLGGTVCPRCALPSSFNLLAPNLLLGKLQRCPHCGRWSLMRRASPAELAAAEARWHGDQAKQSTTDESKEQRIRRQIDDSRYEG